MKRKKLILVAVIVIFIAGVVFAVSQKSEDRNMKSEDQNVKSEDRNMKSEDRNILMSHLHSDDWHQRARAVDKLLASRNLLRSEEVRNALIDLLDRENHLVESTIRESHGLEGVSVKYGEGYSEYYSVLLGAVDQVADYNDERTLNILVHGSYNADSPFAIKLASHGGVVVPMLLELAGSDIAPSRANALGVLGEVLKVEKYRARSLPEDTREEVEQALIRGTADEDVGVRMLAVRSLGFAGGKDTVQLLERIAQSDPAAIPTDVTSRSKYPVREEALKAINLIKTEEKRKPM